MWVLRLFSFYRFWRDFGIKGKEKGRGIVTGQWIIFFCFFVVTEQEG